MFMKSASIFDNEIVRRKIRKYEESRYAVSEFSFP